MKFTCIKAVILDWAGTTVDFGSLAPVAALQRAFETAGVTVTPEEVRQHMGTLKKDQIRLILEGPLMIDRWTAVHGAAPTERDVESIFEDFIPKQAEILAEYSEPIEGVPETVAAWRAGGLRLGSTTGYTRELLDIVAAPAAKSGYSPDASVTPDEVGGGRPKPFMCYRNAILLGVFPLWRCVKIGDTPADIGEGLNAGMWTIGITSTGNEIGLARAEWEALAPEERATRSLSAARRLMDAGAHFTAPSLASCTELLIDIERRIAAGEKP
jgi:phosphonoacetaldehyde hydrolase